MSGEAPIEGRARPLSRLAGWWQEVVEGAGLRIVLLEGEAGIGKSHLSAHFLRACRNSGGQGHELQCWPYNDNATLYPVVAWGSSVPVALWGLFWLVMGAGAAKNAWRGVNSIHVPARFRRKPRH